MSTSGTATPHRSNLKLAIAKVKEALGLMLSKSEAAALDKWAAGVKGSHESPEDLVEVGAESEEG